MSRRLFILGSTGSIGRNTVEVVQHLRSLDGDGSWPVVGLAAGDNTELIEKQAALLNVDAVSLQVEHVSKVAHVYCGEDAAAEMIRGHAEKGDLVVVAIVGFAGILPVLAAIERGCDIALANKECMVAGGELVMETAKKTGSRILPVDSEHSAIFQCIAGRPNKEIAKIILTASGGSLRNMTKQEMESATVEDVLAHPTWDMGQKVTVDSASLMNKSLELVEAHWLFGVESDRLDALIHPQSIVHGFVEFTDGSIVAQLSPPDMKLPIQYALTWPDRVEGCSRTIDWNDLGSLDFEPVDLDRYPAIGLAHEVIKIGGTAGTVINAANEVVVAAFLEHILPFGSMVGIVEEVLAKSTISRQFDFDSVATADEEARSLTTQIIASVRVNS